MVECASLDYIFTILNSNIDTIKEILLSTKIIEIQEVIKDEFASININ